MAQSKIPIDRETLERLYIHEKRSPKEIAVRFGRNRQTIINRLREYNVPVRTKSAGTALAKTIHHRADFSGNLIEKAYLIGLRLGDLTVDMANIGGQTIRVSCASTRPKQIELIKMLFLPYGHIVLNGPYKNGRVSIQCLMNMSFEFLLPKEDDIPSWIMQNDTAFWSFLGGYADAEAHIGISGSKASFRLATADETIISKLSNKLSGFGIHGPKPYIWLSKGSVNSRGVISKRDIWRLGVYRADSLTRLLENLESHLLHDKRKRDASMVMEFLRK